MRYFRSRHRTDIPKYLSNVRYWLNGGKHMLALSFSAVDPTETLGLIRICTISHSRSSRKVLGFRHHKAWSLRGAHADQAFKTARVHHASRRCS
jgi:hypothetical protein